jgi:hypothetical protein
MSAILRVWCGFCVWHTDHRLVHGRTQQCLIPSKLNGWAVLRVWKGAVYVRIPRDLQTPTPGCRCDYCKAHPEDVSAWDTLGIPLSGSNRTTWTLHAPEWKSTDTVTA